MRPLPWRPRSKPVKFIRAKPPYRWLVTTVGVNQTANSRNKQSGRGTGQRRSRRRNGGDSVGRYFGDAWSLAKRTAYGLNEIRKLINVEEKELVTTVTATAINNTGVVSPISRIAQGTDYTQRIGNSIKMQRIEVRCRLFQHAAATQQ